MSTKTGLEKCCARCLRRPAMSDTTKMLHMRTKLCKDTVLESCEELVRNETDIFKTFLCLRASGDELHLMFVAANSVQTSLAFEQHVI